MAWMASVVVHIPLGSMPVACLSDGTPGKIEEYNILCTSYSQQVHIFTPAFTTIDADPYVKCPTIKFDVSFICNVYLIHLELKQLKKTKTHVVCSLLFCT